MKDHVTVSGGIQMRSRRYGRQNRNLCRRYRAERVAAAKRRHEEEIERLRREIEMGDKGARKELVRLLSRSGMKWYDQARMEIEVEERVDIKSSHKQKDHGVTFYYMEASGRGISGESKWIVFKDWTDAERYATAEMEDTLRQEPEHYERDLRRFMFVTDTDARVIAGDEADLRVSDLSDADVFADIEEMGSHLSGEIEDVDYRIGEVEYEIDDLEEAGGDTSRLSRKLKKLERRREDLIESAREELSEREYDRVYNMIKTDLEGYMDYNGVDSPFDVNWITFDYNAAAEDYVANVGTPDILDTHDGYPLDLPGGAVAFGQ